MDPASDGNRGADAGVARATLAAPSRSNMRMGVRKLLVLIGTAAAFFAAAASSQAKTTQFTLFEAPRELLSSDDALRAQTLDEIQGMGVNYLRVVILWRSVAPSSASSTPPPGFDDAGQDGYLWAPYDRAINEARARGMDVLVTISGPMPKLARRKQP